MTVYDIPAKIMTDQVTEQFRITENGDKSTFSIHR